MRRFGFTAAALLMSLGLWIATGWLASFAGLGRFDLLVRVLMMFPLLGLLDRGLERIATGFPGPTAESGDTGHDH